VDEATPKSKKVNSGAWQEMLALAGMPGMLFSEC
jgi:hypothetical protein